MGSVRGPPGTAILRSRPPVQRFGASLRQGSRPDKAFRRGERLLTNTKSRNLWEEIGQISPISVFRFPSMGPKSPVRDDPHSGDRQANRISNRTQGHHQFYPRQFEIILDGTRMVFCTHASRSVDKFFADRLSTLLVIFNLWPVFRGNERRLLCHPEAPQLSTFGSTEEQCCALGGQREASTASRKQESPPFLRSAQVAGSRADLVKVASQREDAIVKEAHRNRIRTTIPNILTGKIPGSRKSSPMRHATGVWRLCSRGIGTRYSTAKIIE